MNDAFFATPPPDDAIPTARPVAYLGAFTTILPPDPIHLRDQPRSAAWWDALLLVVGVIFFEMAGGLALNQWYGPADTEEARAALHRRVLLPSIAIRSTVTLAIIALILRWRRQGLSAIGLSSTSLGINVLLGLPLLGAAAFLVYGLMSMLVILWPELMKQMQENSGRLMAIVPPLPAWGFALLMSIVGFYEEALFRGFLMLRLRRGFESWTLAVIVSSALFVIPHAAEQTWAALIPISILSLSFSVATIWRRSIVPAIVAHALFNTSVALILKMYAGSEWK